MRFTDFSLQWGLSLQLVGAQATLWAALSAGNGYAVSNGSYKANTGVAAWIIEGPNSTLCLISQWHTPGHKDDHSSFHSELAGIVGVNLLATNVPQTSKMAGM